MKSYLCAFMYKIIRNILFFFDAEKVHHFSMNLLQGACNIRPVAVFLQKIFSPVKAGGSNAFGLTFPNIVGLSAGFDKNAKYLRELAVLGFGFVEIGTVTPLPQEGNPKPRLFRLPKDRALINRMGFNNDGVEMVAQRLSAWRKNQRMSYAEKQLIIGGNIGKNKITPNDTAWKDYETCFNALHSFVDYFVVNVSSPNTPGLRELQEKEALRTILAHLQKLNNNFPTRRPILLKIAPDLTNEQLNDVADLALEISLDGLVVANTTVSRENLKTGSRSITSVGAGGLSGAPLAQRSTDVVSYIVQRTNAKIPVIACGGIFTGEDAAEKLQAGAALIQVWTGFVYEGPGIVKKILNKIATRGARSFV